MGDNHSSVAVYLESGQKRVFAGAVEWPGWCRSGRDEESALRALLDYGPRYAQVLAGTGIWFDMPDDLAALVVTERLPGNSTTDFGSPGAVPTADGRAVDEGEREWLEKVLAACWQAFDAAVEAAGDRSLRKGPRGGGRETDQIVRHVLEADAGYLSRLGWKLQLPDGAGPGEALRITRQAALEGLAASARGELPATGPRGGVRWSARYFVRRVAWHALDHAWEIADRSG